MARSPFTRLQALRTLQEEQQQMLLLREEALVARIRNSMLGEGAAMQEHQRQMHSALLQGEPHDRIFYQSKIAHSAAYMAALRSEEKLRTEIAARQRELYVEARRVRLQMDALCEAEAEIARKERSRREQTELDDWFLLRKKEKPQRGREGSLHAGN